MRKKNTLYVVITPIWELIILILLHDTANAVSICANQIKFLPLSSKIHGSICREILEQYRREILAQICKNYCVNSCVVSIGSFVGGRRACLDGSAHHRALGAGWERYFRLLGGSSKYIGCILGPILSEIEGNFLKTLVLN